jgi:very-short-patch-repair endonuclease
MLFSYIPQIPTGKVQTFICADVQTSASQAEASGSTEPGANGCIKLSWNELPSHDHILEDLLQAIAQTALTIWPRWYGGKADFNPKGMASLDDELLTDFKLKQLAATEPEVYLPWLKSAMACCQESKAPALSQSFATTIQFKQLALVIKPRDLVVVLAVRDLNPQQYRLHSLTRISTWIAQETGARVAVLVPEHLQEHQELDSILYGAIKLPAAASAMDLATTVLEPVSFEGKPHHLSPGEQILSTKLLRDAELCKLFSFNQSVEARHGRKYLVDLLWREGKVIVEIDGYRTHGNEFSFTEDRNRDYELLISGYLVLRITHDEVINDLEVVVEKVRDVVRFRRNQKTIGKEVLQ